MHLPENNPYKGYVNEKERKKNSCVSNIPHPHKFLYGNKVYISKSILCLKRDVRGPFLRHKTSFQVAKRCHVLFASVKT